MTQTVSRTRASSDRILHAALALSLGLHAGLLAVRFVDEVKKKHTDRGLEVVLVNARSQKAPDKAQVLAQASLDGGGNSDKDTRIKTPTPASQRNQVGEELVEKRKRVTELEAAQRELLNAAQKSQPETSRRALQSATPSDIPPQPRGSDLVSRALEMAKLEGEISRNTSAYAKRPRKAFIGTRSREFRLARYAEDWRQKVERIGNLNYPEAARGKLYGNLVMTIIILPDGSIKTTEINRSSGHKVLDDAARKIVRMAAPYAPFPADIRRDYDQIEIVRTWFFTQGNRLDTR